MKEPNQMKSKRKQKIFEIKICDDMPKTMMDYERTNHFQFSWMSCWTRQIFPLTRIIACVTSIDTLNCQNTAAFAQFRNEHIHFRGDWMVVESPQDAQGQVTIRQGASKAWELSHVGRLFAKWKWNDFRRYWNLMNDFFERCDLIEDVPGIGSRMRTKNKTKNSIEKISPEVPLTVNVAV